MRKGCVMPNRLLNRKAIEIDAVGIIPPLYQRKTPQIREADAKGQIAGGKDAQKHGIITFKEQQGEDAYTNEGFSNKDAIRKKIGKSAQKERIDKHIRVQESAM